MNEYEIDARSDVDKLADEVRRLRERVDDLEHIKVVLRTEADACYSWAEEFANALRIIADGSDREAGELAEIARGVLAGEEWSKAESARGRMSKSVRRRLRWQQAWHDVRGILPWKPGDEPAEVAVRRIRDEEYPG
jgi:hypothetical protein